MAYPFGHWTWDRLIDELASKHNVEFHERGSIANPSGHAAPLQYFEMSGNRPRRYAISFADRNEPIHPNVLRSICAGLELDPKDFGLSLG